MLGDLLAREDEAARLKVQIDRLRQECSGPLWVRGGIPLIGADGRAYEIRNRMTLCRCGRSENKPFCNGGHAADPKFRDGLAPTGSR